MKLLMLNFFSKKYRALSLINNNEVLFIGVYFFFILFQKTKIN